MQGFDQLVNPAILAEQNDPVIAIIKLGKMDDGIAIIVGLGEIRTCLHGENLFRFEDQSSV